MTTPHDLEALICAESKGAAPGRDRVWERVSDSLAAGSPASVSVEPDDAPTVVEPETGGGGPGLKVVGGPGLKVVGGLGVGVLAVGVAIGLALWAGPGEEVSGEAGQAAVAVDPPSPEVVEPAGEVGEVAMVAIENPVNGEPAASANFGGPPSGVDPLELEGETPRGRLDSPAPADSEPAHSDPDPNPVPDPVPVPPSEMKLVARAIRGLRREDYREVLRAVSTLDETYPEGALMEERDGLRALALCGQSDPRSEPRAVQFLADYPASTYAPRVRATCL